MAEENIQQNNAEQQPIYDETTVDYYKARQSDINTLKSQLETLDSVLSGISSKAVENEIDALEQRIANVAKMVEEGASASKINAEISAIEIEIANLITQLNEISQGDPNTGYGDLNIIILLLQFIIVLISYLVQSVFEIADVNVPLIGVGLLLLPFAWLRDGLQFLSYTASSLIKVTLWFIDNLNPSQGILKTIENILIPINTILESLINVLHLISLDLIDTLTQFAMVLLNSIGRIF